MESKQTAAKPGHLLNLVLTALLAAVYGMILYQSATGSSISEANEWMLNLLILLAALNSLTCVAKELQWQYVLPAGLFAAVIGSAAHFASFKCGIPFGPFVLGPIFDVHVYLVMACIPFIWVIAVFSSRGVARLILKPWRKVKTYGFWLIGLTAVLATLFDLGMDPFLSHLNHYWIWSATKLPVTWAGAPVLNFMGWLVITLLILAFATPLLIKKKPGTKSVPEYHPLGVWVGAMLLFAIAMGKNSLWPEAILDVVAIVVATVPAIRGGRW